MTRANIRTLIFSACLFCGAGLAALSLPVMAQNPSVEVNYDVLDNTAVRQHYRPIEIEEERKIPAPAQPAPPQQRRVEMPDLSAPVLTAPEGIPLPAVPSQDDGTRPLLTDPDLHRGTTEDEIQPPQREDGTELRRPVAPETAAEETEKKTKSEIWPHKRPARKPVAEISRPAAPPRTDPPIDSNVVRTEPDALPENLAREMMGLPHRRETPAAAPADLPSEETAKPAPRPDTAAERSTDKAADKGTPADIPLPEPRPETAATPSDAPYRVRAAADDPVRPAAAPVPVVAAEALPLPEPAPSSAPSALELRLVFSGHGSSITPEMQNTLQHITRRMSEDRNLRLQLHAFATGEGGNPSSARRISLSRALNVRDYLVQSGGIHTTRMDVRALGDETDHHPVDRLDFVFVE